MVSGVIAFQAHPADNTILIYIKICDLCSSLFFKIFAGMKDGMMLDLGCDDVVSFGFICFKGSFQCPVIRLGTACCKINFFFFGISASAICCLAFDTASLLLCAKS